jgi:hypothetical protein
MLRDDNDNSDDDGNDDDIVTEKWARVPQIILNV